MGGEAVTIDDLASGLRQAAWQRAKGELLSLQCLSCPPDGTAAQYDAHRERADAIRDCIRDFISRMEANGWNE